MKIAPDRLFPPLRETISKLVDRLPTIVFLGSDVEQVGGRREATMAIDGKQARIIVYPHNAASHPMTTHVTWIAEIETDTGVVSVRPNFVDDVRFSEDDEELDADAAVHKILSVDPIIGDLGPLRQIAKSESTAYLKDRLGMNVGDLELWVTPVFRAIIVDQLTRGLSDP